MVNIISFTQAWSHLISLHLLTHALQHSLHLLSRLSLPPAIYSSHRCGVEFSKQKAAIYVWPVTWQRSSAGHKDDAGLEKYWNKDTHKLQCHHSQQNRRHSLNISHGWHVRHNHPCLRSETALSFYTKVFLTLKHGSQEQDLLLYYTAWMWLFVIY